MAKNKKKRTFGGAKDAADRRDSGSNFGYVKIPKDIQMFIPENECTVVMDILPYEVTDTDHLDKREAGDAWYKRPVKVHKNIGVNKDAYVCPTTFGDPCPICEQRQALLDDGADYKDENVKALKPSLRNLYVVKIRDYDGNSKKYDKKKTYLFDFSDYLFQENFEKQLKKKEEFDTFFHPEQGMSLEVTFDEDTFGGNKFATPTRFDFVKRKKQYDEDIIDDVPKLDEILVVADYDTLDAKFHGDVPAEDEKKDKKKKKKKKEKPVEEEEAPKKEKKSKKKSKKSESEEDTSSGNTKDKKKKKKEKCPYGHKFGKDADSFEDCNDCKLWNECREASGMPVEDDEKPKKKDKKDKKKKKGKK